MPQKLLTKGSTAASNAAAPKRAVKVTDEGIVVAIVAVTGVVDAVGDLIQPGALTGTLKVRRPKVVDDHEWQRKVGRVLHVEEWLPGDPRLPKQTKDGKPWPKAAGALVATMQYNLNTERGRESFAEVKFYAESNEAEFSIGYKVPPGKAIKRQDGVRVIFYVDLFEFSHVLFGAAPLSMALEVKNVHGGSAGAVTAPSLTPSKRSRTDTDEDEDKPFPEVKKPDADAPWEDEPERKSARQYVLEAKAGNAENLREWYVAGGDGQIPWGSDGDYAACVEIASKHMSPEDAKGYCNLRHHDALGIYPATHAAMEGKDASAPTDQEVKAMSNMKGSYEERRELIRAAAQDLLSVSAECEHPWVNLVATYDTECIVSYYEADDLPRSYLIPYSIAEHGGVELGTPEPVELSLVAEPSEGSAVVRAADEDVETVTVVGPLLAAVQDAYAAASRVTEGKSREAIADAVARIHAQLQGKSAEPDTEDSQDAPPAGDTTDTDVITRDNLPEGDWAKYRKTQPIEALRMDGPFEVETREGKVSCDDGWLAIDSDGYPYPIAAEEMGAVYTPDGDDAAADAHPEPDAEPDGDADDTAAGDDDMPSNAAVDAAIATEEANAAAGDAADDEGAGDGAAGDDEDPDERVKLDPEEHFAAMDRLSLDDNEDE